MGKIRINGYCDQLNVKADEEIDVMISAENTKAVSSKIVRIGKMIKKYLTSEIPR